MDIEFDKWSKFTDIDTLLNNVEICDILHINKDGQNYWAIYIGSGSIVYLKQLKRRLQIDGDQKTSILVEYEKDGQNRVGPTNLKTIAGEGLTITVYEDKDKPQWTRVENVLKNIQKHDLIEIKRTGYTHWAIAVDAEGNIVDLTPSNKIIPSCDKTVTATVDSNDTQSDEPSDLEARKSQSGIVQEKMPSVEATANSGDTQPLISGAPSDVEAKHRSLKFGIVRKRPLAEVVKSSQVRINNLSKYRNKVGSPCSSTDIDENIKAALKAKTRKYNVLTNNCEHFVVELKHGTHFCSQRERRTKYCCVM